MFRRSYGVACAFIHDHIEWAKRDEVREISPGAEIGLDPRHRVSRVFVLLRFLAHADGFDGEIYILRGSAIALPQEQGVISTVP